MDLTHQLTPMLKSLRLSGILETLEVRNRSAIESKLSYVEFLAQLVEDEVERRAQHKLKMRLRRATFGTSVAALWNRPDPVDPLDSTPPATLETPKPKISGPARGCLAGRGVRARMTWCLGAESNHRHGDFQSPALPTELPRL